MQENVGRLQGIYPHGIAIVQVADYFAVGNRGRAFTSVARDVAALDLEYACALVRHLVGTSCVHWDRGIRDLAAQSVGALGSSAGEFIVEMAIPELVILYFSQVLDSACLVYRG